MKKVLLIFCFIFITSLITACEPTTTAISINTSIAQSTTYVAVTNIFVEVDQAEVCLGNQVNLVVTFLPTNATNQAYTVTLNPGNLIAFSGTNHLLIDVIGEDPSGEVIAANVTVTSDDNTSIDDTKGIYIHHSSTSICTP